MQPKSYPVPSYLPELKGKIGELNRNSELYESFATEGIKSADMACSDENGAPRATLASETSARPSGKTISSLEYHQNNPAAPTPVSSMMLPGLGVSNFLHGMTKGCKAIKAGKPVVVTFDPSIQQAMTPIIDGMKESCGDAMIVASPGDSYHDDTNWVEMQGMPIGWIRDAVPQLEGVRMGCEVMKSVSEAYCDGKVIHEREQRLSGCGIKHAESNITSTLKRIDAMNLPVMPQQSTYRTQPYQAPQMNPLPARSARSRARR